MSNAFIRLLRRLFGDYGAMTAYVALRNGLAWSVFFCLFLAACATLYAFSWFLREGRLAESRTDRFTLHPVRGSQMLHTHTRPVLLVDVVLPDGKRAQLHTRETRIAWSVADVVCVETRVETKSGQPRYRLAERSACGGP